MPQNLLHFVRSVPESFAKVIESTYYLHEREIHKSYSLLQLRKRAHTTKKKAKNTSNLLFHIVFAYYLIDSMPHINQRLEGVLDMVYQALLGKENSEGTRYVEWLLRFDTDANVALAKKKQLVEMLAQREKELIDDGSEGAAYEERDVAKEGLLTHQAVRCLLDMDGRTLPLLYSISEMVKPGMNVCEIGIGTGILSFSSLFAGAAQVTGIELNPITCLLVKCASEFLEERAVIAKNALEIYWADALTWEKRKGHTYSYADFHVVISENLYTGMLYEKQVQMMNRVHKDCAILGLSSPMLIPQNISSYFIPVMSSEALPLDSLPCNDRSMEHIQIVPLSSATKYSSFDLQSYCHETVIAKNLVEIHKDGCIDALCLYSEIQVHQSYTIGRNENEFLNNDHVLRLATPLQVAVGDLVEITLIYAAGGTIKDGVLQVRLHGKDL